MIFNLFGCLIQTFAAIDTSCKDYVNIMEKTVVFLILNIILFIITLRVPLSGHIYYVSKD